MADDAALAAREYLRQARAPNTLRAYLADWRHFARWCGAQGREALPASPETVALYLSELAGARRVSTLKRRLASLAQAHRAAGWDSPAGAAAVRALLAGIRRAHGTAARQKKPLLLSDLEKIVAALPADRRGARDAALLLTGFAGAFRRSELVALDWEDLEFGKQGVLIRIRRSKTDPEGEGRTIAIPYGRRAALCPVRALQAWKEQSGAGSGPVFVRLDRHGNVGRGRLSDRAVARAVQRLARAAGASPGDYAGHSLRAGFATAAAAGGASERAILRQTGHRSLPLLRRYIRAGSLFADNAVPHTGL